MVRRQASAIKQRMLREAKPASPYIHRKLPPVDLLDEEALYLIEEQVEWLTETVGVEFRADPRALDIWCKAGANVNDTRVRLPRGMARELLAIAPETFIQHARNPARSVQIGGDAVVFAPVIGAPFVSDYDGGRRYGSINDFEKLVKLTASFPVIHHGGFHICEPCDLPVNKRHLDMVYAHLRYSDRPFLGAITEMVRAEHSVEMMRIVFGEDFVDKNCVILGNVNTNSPLYVDRVVTESIYAYCGAGQGVVVVPFILSGAMGPVTTAAAIAQALAEAMVCGAFTQLVRKGSCFVLGNFLSSMNLRSGSPTFGTPEPVLSNYVIGQLARRLKVPLRCGGSLTASKKVDAQAMAESADSMHSTVMGGANFVPHAAGWLESGLVASFEKIVMDADRLGAYEVLLKGLDVSKNGLGQQAYTDVEPTGHFLGSSHTMTNYQTAFYESAMSDSNSYEQWLENGSLDAFERASKRVKAILNDYEAPPIDPAIDEALRAYLAKKKAEVPDAWY